MSTATAKQKLPSEASSAKTSERSASPSGEPDQPNNSTQQTVEARNSPESGFCPSQVVRGLHAEANAEYSNVQNPASPVGQTPVFGVCQPQRALPNAATMASHNKLPESIIVPIDTIEYDPNLPVDDQLTEHITTSIDVPWGRLMIPLMVSRLPVPKENKEWLLWDGKRRLIAAERIGLTHVRVIVVGGTDVTEDEIRLLAHEIDMVRRHPTPYERMRQIAQWHEVLQCVYAEYKPGGNKKKKAKANLPTLGLLVEKTTGLKKSAFYGKVQAYQAYIPELRQYLDEHPHCSMAKKDVWLRDLAKYTPDDQKKLAPYLKKLSNPNDAYFQAMREEAVEKAKSLPDDNLFRIYHEDFRENAKRLRDETVNLIATDPNWHLADDSEEGEMWTLHGVPVAPKLTAKDWHEFGSLAAQKLAKDGLVGVLVGVQNGHEINTILRQHLKWRWTMCYLLTSGSGTVCRKSGFTSHQRWLLVYERMDAPERAGTYKQFVHDVVPKISKYNNTPESLIGLLKLEQAGIDKHIASLGADDPDLYIDDLIGTVREKTDAVKTWHPWA